MFFNYAIIITDCPIIVNSKAGKGKESHMTESEALKYLEQAKNYYTNADLPQALDAAQKAYIFYESVTNNMQALDVFTLLQTIYAYMQCPSECLALEQTIYMSVHALFTENATELYSLHLLDLVSQLLHMEQTDSAKAYLHVALDCMKQAGTDDDHLSFLQNCFYAHIYYIEEHYHAARETAGLANTLWESCSGPNTDAYGLQNLLLLCAINAKLGHPVESIRFLEQTISQNIFSPYQAISAEIILAELYLKNDMADKALAIYQKYAHHPLITCALAPADDRAMKYNYGVSLVISERYKDALSCFRQLEEHGYSMQLALLSHLGDFDSIRRLTDDAIDYYTAQVREILAHYNEELTFTHMDELQYHINLTLDAYIRAKVTPGLVYSYLLNTKYISLEAGWLREDNIPHYEAKQVMQSLSDDTLLLEYTVSLSLQGMNYTVFLISSHEIHMIPLGSCEPIDRLISEYRAFLKASRDCTIAEDPALATELRRLNTALRKQLYLPIREVVERYADLIIAPAGELVHFPFAMLSTSAKGILCDTHSLVYCNCGKELLHHRKPDEASCDARHFDAPLIIGSPLADHMPALPHAAREAALVADYLQTRAYIGSEADIRLFEHDAIIKSDMLHIAAHGIFAPDSETPRSGQADWNALKRQLSESGLLLSQNTLLSCEGISRLPLKNMKLAVLSCCHSGDSSYRTTEGTYGLRRSFIQAGCSCLLVNLWQVDDEASLTFTDSFYDALINQSLNPIQAFYHTTKQLKDQLHPYYWAGYQLII